MTDKRYEWDGAPVVQTASGALWLRQPDGRYRGLSDFRAVVTDDHRVWGPVTASCGVFLVWWSVVGGAPSKSTEELAAMGARLLIDSGGKAVL